MCCFLCACTQKNDQKSDKQFDLQQAADTWRYETPEGTIAPKDISSNLSIQLKNNFPVWKESLLATLDLSIKNTSKSHLPCRGSGYLYIYSTDEKKPLYWSVIDLAFAEPAERGVVSILSLPAMAVKDIVIPLKATRWTSVTQKTWPDTSFYQLIPSGRYLMRFELELYTEDDKLVDTVLSNFVEFTTVQNLPAQ